MFEWIGIVLGNVDKIILRGISELYLYHLGVDILIWFRANIHWICWWRQASIAHRPLSPHRAYASSPSRTSWMNSHFSAQSAIDCIGWPPQYWNRTNICLWCLLPHQDCLRTRSTLNLDTMSADKGWLCGGSHIPFHLRRSHCQFWWSSCWVASWNSPWPLVSRTRYLIPLFNNIS